MGGDGSYPISEYSVKIDGLDNYSGGNSTSILVPIPTIYGETAYSNEDFSGEIPVDGEITQIDHGFTYSLYVSRMGN